MQRQKWKHACETVVLDGASNALGGQEDNNLLKLIFGIQPSSNKELQLDPTGRKNIKGLQICHEVMLVSPWEEPKNIDRLIRDLVEHKKPAIEVDPTCLRWEPSSTSKQTKQSKR